MTQTEQKLLRQLLAIAAGHQSNGITVAVGQRRHKAALKLAEMHFCRIEEPPTYTGWVTVYGIYVPRK